MKIAPTLSCWYLSKKPIGPTPLLKLLKEVKGCRAELRALLAVARAAKVITVDGIKWDDGSPLDNLARALDRLDRVSGKGDKP